MADPNDQSTDDTTASDQPGGSSQVDIAGIVQQAVDAALAGVDTRFTGFQSLMDKKLAKLSNEFKTARLSPEEQAQLEDEGEEDDVAQALRELELYRMQDQFPRGVQRLLAMARAESLEDQLALIESLEDPKAAAQAAEAAAEADAAQTPVPEVDPNNPARPVKAGLASSLEAGEMTEEAANAILGIEG